MPAPSPTTKPSRSLSKGRQAWVGSSLRVESAFMAAKPPTESGVMAPSVPPAIMASASPRWMVRKASPMACAELVQAVAVASLGPLAPYLMLTWPAARLMMVAGMKNGEILRGPPFISAVCSRSMTSNPPMPEPMWTPMLSAFSGVTCRPECCMASCCGGHGEVDEAAHLAGLFFIDEDVGVEVLDLGGKADGVACEIVGGDLRHATLARDQAFPDLRRSVAYTADKAHARNDDTTLLPSGVIPRALS